MKELILHWELRIGIVINNFYFIAKSIKDIFSGINIEGTSNSLLNKNIPGKKTNCKNLCRMYIHINIEIIYIDKIS